MDESENEKRSSQGLFDELVIDSRPLPRRDKYRTREQGLYPMNSQDLLIA